MTFEELSKKELKDIIVYLANENKKLKEIIKNQKKQKITFKKLANKYLETRKNVLALSTYLSYKNIVENHLVKYFGDMMIYQINVLVIEKYISDKSCNLSNNTIKKHQIMLNLIFKFAIRIKLIDENPMSNVIAVKTTRPMTNFYKADDLKKLFLKIKDSNIYGLVLLCSLGLRRSEALAVKWEDIDFENSSLKVRGKIDVNNNYSYILKNKTSYRIIVIPRWFLEELKKIRSNSLSQWVCCEKNSLKHITASSASHSFKYYIDKFDLKPITLKGLRHTCATLISSQGYNLNYVKDWLGHSTIKITADIYSHIDVSDKKKIAEKINSEFEC